MTTYTWKIESVDTATNTMLVEFVHDEVSQLLNLPTPPEGTELGAWVDGFAPRDRWNHTRSAVVAGATGTAQVAVEATPPSEPPQIAGSFQEEYLRAMIYQVMEEIRESTV